MDTEPEEVNSVSRRASIVAAVNAGEFPADRNEWASAYAQQSRSDFAVYKLLTNQELSKQCLPLNEVDQCHSLHYLQMACEKIAKAYRFRDTGTPLEKLLTSHVAFSKFMRTFVTTAVVKALYKNNPGVLRHVIQITDLLSREIEVLAPALGNKAQPYNTEYPWADSMQIITPCTYSFPSVDILRKSEARNFLKIVGIAITDFEKTRKDG